MKKETMLSLLAQLAHSTTNFMLEVSLIARLALLVISAVKSHKTRVPFVLRATTAREALETAHSLVQQAHMATLRQARRM